ncbi:TrkA family potassium uptake protein [Aeromicrobium phragmitis]|uniref:TrkA family potassium uptake protein n=1 Tax=Aeromicrobium phragmitis TaxID=2478914 RepID=A0A3L8PK76_9ACTN|nr:TrkA family potassium uptake protein [Aeromicrobium phragmitis]RLV54998.1 TrkA family potassium uptake protein [Aeromicrobium phragmitis]
MVKLHLFGGTDPAEVAAADSVVVIGLGRFGQALALELMDNGTDVLGIDEREDAAQSLNGLLTHVVQADATKEEALRQLSVHEFDRAVVAIGTDIEASILVTSLLLRFGIRDIWAKAVSDPHGAILEQLGVGHVVYPEKDMGRRVAHLVRGRMQDYIEVGDDFALVKTTVHPEFLGRPLGETGIRGRFGVTVTAFKREGQPWSYATAETVLEPGDTILVTGPVRRAESFSQRM